MCTADISISPYFLSKGMVMKYVRGWSIWGAGNKKFCSECAERGTEGIENGGAIKNAPKRGGD